jgi:uncharacterized membrane protein
MKPLIVLLVTFVIALVVTKIANGYCKTALSARIAMSVMLLFTASAHFAFTKGMAMMVPSFIPYKTEIIYATGIIEIIAAIGLLIPNFKETAGWLLILFFVLLLPANINAAIKHIDYQKGTLEGNGVNYLWFRIPLQILFILWTYLCSIRF